MTSQNLFPEIIQGGMGAYVSNPFLANEVSKNGALGTVSGVATERIMAIILGRGDPGGHYRRALAHFPSERIAERVLNAFYIEESNPLGLKSRVAPMFTINPSDLLVDLTVCANFAFVWLAKEGHNNPVGINYLTEIRLPQVFAIYGAMLAGVGYIIMGAGIPLRIREVIDALAEGKTANYSVPVVGSKTGHVMSFNPAEFFLAKAPLLDKPRFIPIISSNLLASILMKRVKGGIDGFVVEGPTAGGHNAPPRKGADEYGPNDEVDYAQIAEFGLPFWIAGSMASPEKLKWAKSKGATGIQVGTIFALCKKSGLYPTVRQAICELGFNRNLGVRTDKKASPTGFPFKVVVLPGTLSEESVYLAHKRGCGQGILRILYEKPDGSIGYRCPAEPVQAYLDKFGKIEDTEGKRCLCTCLLANVGLMPEDEPLFITLGDDISFLPFLMKHSKDSYGVVEALQYLRG